MAQPYLWETIKDLNRLAILFPDREAIGNIGVGQEWQNTIPEGLTSIHLELGE